MFEVLSKFDASVNNPKFCDTSETDVSRLVIFLAFVSVPFEFLKTLGRTGCELFQRCILDDNNATSFKDKI